MTMTTEPAQNENTHHAQKVNPRNKVVTQVGSLSDNFSVQSSPNSIQMERTATIHKLMNRMGWTLEETVEALGLEVTELPGYVLRVKDKKDLKPPYRF